MTCPPLPTPHHVRPFPPANYARYESDTALAQYCDAHYGPDKFGVANFPARLVQRCLAALPDLPGQRALDLGCAVGRATFELARHFAQVDGVDLSGRFIDLARYLKERGHIRYRLPEEGDLVADRDIRLDDLGLAAHTPNVRFFRCNAEQLDEHFRDYNLILVANLIDRLAEPRRFLATLHTRLVVGGLLAIASPYCWREEFTSRRQWLGGRFRSGSPLESLRGMSEALARHFTVVGSPLDVEFVIRETARTFQHGISQLTLWQRIR